MKCYFLAILTILLGAMGPAHAQDATLCIQITDGLDIQKARVFDLTTGTLTDWEYLATPQPLPSPNGQAVAQLYPDGQLSLEIPSSGVHYDLKTNIDLNDNLWTWDWAWSPDGEHFVFVGSDGTAYFLLHATPTGDVTLYPSEHVQLDIGDWSSDGRYFSLHLVEQSTGASGTMLMDVETMQVVSPILYIYAGQTGWSPDKTRFAGLDSNSVLIFHDGIVEYANTRGPLYPGWAHDGHRFAHGVDEAIVVVNGDTIEQTYALPQDVVVLETSTWSPDDTVLMVIVSDANKSFSYRALAFAPQHESVQAPIWFVDSGLWVGQQWFIWQTNEADQLGLIRFDGATGQFETLQTNVVRKPYSSLISPDGKYLVTVSGGPDEGLIVERLHLEDETRLTITDNATSVPSIEWLGDMAFVATANQLFVSGADTLDSIAFDMPITAIEPLSNAWVVVADAKSLQLLNLATGAKHQLGALASSHPTLQATQLETVIYLDAGNAGAYFLMSNDPTRYLAASLARQVQVAPSGDHLAFLQWNNTTNGVILSLEVIDLADFTLANSVVVQNQDEFHGRIAWQVPCNGE